jgi:beta-lactam-binding protein with PASTA domain
MPLFVVLLAGCAGSHADKGPTVSVSVASGQTQTAVPKVIVETSRNAVRELHTAGFSVRERHQAVGGNSRSGIVLSQDPRRGELANTGSVVRITVGR